MESFINHYEQEFPLEQFTNKWAWHYSQRPYAPRNVNKPLSVVYVGAKPLPQPSEMYKKVHNRYGVNVYTPQSVLVKYKELGKHS